MWSAIVAWTGGFDFHISGLRVSSRNYRNAIEIGTLAGLTAIGLVWRAGGWQALRGEWSLLIRCLAAIPRRVASQWPAITPAVAIAAVGIAFQIFQWASAPPLWLDEEMILLNVRDRSWGELGGSLWLGQSAPLGWLLAERAVMALFGTGELAVRLIPVLFGIGTILVALWMAARWLGPIGGAVLVLLCVFGQHIAHYAFEAKHYTADVFWAALLPALAVWVIEGDDERTRIRRSFLWWIAAALGQFLANGGLLAAPGCALVLGISLLRRGCRAAALFALSGLVFLAAFGLHYELSLRATRESSYLHTYWANEIPPASMGLFGRVRWIGGRLEALAQNPGGTEWGLTLWVCAATGLALSGRRTLGVAFATVPLSAFVLSGAGIVPLSERLVLWIVPALYVGLALFIDRAAHLFREMWRRRRWVPAILATPALIVAGTVCLDIYQRGKTDINGRAPDHKHHLDDRAAVRWLTSKLRPGDVLLTTNLGWPAVWWYGDISIANAGAAGVVRHPKGNPLLTVGYVEPGLECGAPRLPDALKGYRRVLVYLGFEGPPGLDFLVMHALDRIGRIEAVNEYSELGRAAVIDLHDPRAGDLTLKDVSPKTAKNAGLLNGCLPIGPAIRW
jgi:hypothetical protein